MQVISSASLAQSVSSQSSEREAARIERLTSLGKLWGAVSFFHPYLAYKDIDWDAAVVSSLPSIEAAESRDELIEALQELLRVLDDPVTHVVVETAPTGPSSPELLEDLQPKGYMMGDGLLVITMTDYADLSDWGAAPERLKEALNGLDSARAVVFDIRKLRGSASEDFDSYFLDNAFSASGAGELLTNHTLVGPSYRRRIHYGYSEDGGGGGVYYSGFLNRDGSLYRPKGNRTVPAVFLVNDRSFVPEMALALQQSGEVAILSEGEVTERSGISTFSVSFSEGVEVTVRIDERIYANGATGYSADSVLAFRSNTEEALTDALEFARSFQPGISRVRDVVPVVTAPVAKDSSEDLAYPSRASRIFAVYKIWHVIDHFFAYKNLMDEPWEAALAEFIPEVETASDSLEYALAVAKMLTLLQDGHVRLQGPTIANYLGETPPPVHVRFIEDIPIVTGFRDDSLAAAAGIRVGDEIVRIDERPVQERIQQIAPYLTASNPWTHQGYVARLLLNGPEGSVSNLAFRGSDGNVREVSLPRSRRFAQAPYRSGEIVRILENNIGYVDLDRLAFNAVDSMFTQLEDTRGIIFDMRGYPDGTAWPIAPRLGLDPSTPFASFRMPIAEPSLSRDLKSRTYQELIQYINGAEVPWVYDRPTVMLIDERTQSQSEHTGLAFAAANGTVFVGSGTAGANGNVTFFTIPGGLSIRFTGLDTRHPDGRQLQRKGLKPDIRVAPTIEGIRSGRDEVLEAAIQYLIEKTD